MKLLCLIGSLRKDSLNRKVFETYKKIVGSKADFIEGKFSDFPLYSGDIEDAGIPENVKKLGELIKSCDGIIFFSPEYNASIPGVLKNAIDWISRLKEAPFRNKPATIIGASPGMLGTSRMQYHLRQVAVTQELNIMTKPEVMIAYADKIFDASGKMTDERTVAFLNKHFDAFQNYIQMISSSATKGK